VREASGDNRTEQEALHFRRALEEILVIARAGMGRQSAALSLARIEGKAQTALASTKVGGTRRPAVSQDPPATA
jgi:hypothetical protein